MIHQKANVTGRLTFSLDAEDWVWLCELLSQILNDNDLDDFCREDTEHILSCLQSVERAK